MIQLNVLSLFDGISCGHLALDRAGIRVIQYFASEVDKHAIKVTQTNYPDTIQLGDVTKVNGADLPSIDLLIGGSPCQGFSFAGSQLNFEDPRSKLFFEYVRILKETKPKWFLLENVLMKKKYQDIISDNLGVQPILIDSAEFCAQSRKRLYWTNIPIRDRCISSQQMVSDIIEHDAPSDLFLTNSYLLKMLTNPSQSRLDVLSEKYRIDHKRGLMKPVLVSEVTMDTPSTRSRQTDRLYSSLSKSPTLLANRACDLKIDMASSNQSNWRTITPVEAERLQTVPDGYTSSVKDSCRFKALGNGWTVNVIAHIFSGITIQN